MLMPVVDIPLTKAARALFARLIFVIHGLIAIWRVVSVSKISAYWLLALMLILIFVEGALIIFTRRGNENRWFCTCIFLYLCAVIPSLWFLQLELSPAMLRERNVSVEVTTLAWAYRESAKLDFVGYSVSVQIPIDNEVWLQLLQQTMLVTVILGRWILPKGDITRDQLSQLLLVFLAMGADIVELFDTFKETIVRNNLNLTFVVLGVWTVSLMQFPLILTGGRPASGLPEHSGKHGKMPQIATRPSMSAKRDSSIMGTCGAEANRDLERRASVDTTDSTVKLQTAYEVSRHEIETSAFEERHPLFQVAHLLAEDMGFWSIIASTFLQDGPYLITRLYLLIAYHTNSFTMVFFTCKNILVVILQWYRLMVISCEYRQRVRFAAYFRKYYEAAEAVDEEISLGSSPSSRSSGSSPTPDTTMPPTAKFLVGNGSRNPRRGMSVSSIISEDAVRRGRRKAGMKAVFKISKSSTSTVEEEGQTVIGNGDRISDPSPVSDTGIFITSSESNVSTFKSDRSYSYGSLSCTAIPYYFTSMAPLSPTLTSGRLIRRYRSCDDDSGVDILFQNEPMCHYF